MNTETTREEAKPVYETPAVRLMTEEEILRSFQVTQAMAAWWTNTTTCVC